MPLYLFHRQDLRKYVSQLYFLQPTGRRGTFLSEEQIYNLLWHSQPTANCVNRTTLLYPQEKLTAPERLRGHIVNDMDVCICCGMCARRCPAGALAVDRKGGIEQLENLGSEDAKWLGKYSRVHMNVFGTPLRVIVTIVSYLVQK